MTSPENSSPEVSMVSLGAGMLVLRSSPMAISGVRAPVGRLTAEQFSYLYHEQFPVLTRFLARGYLSRPEAEDVAQEAFLTLMVKLTEGAPIINIRPYLFAIARHLALRYIDRNNSEIPFDGLPDTIDYAAMDSVSAVEDQPGVQQALQALPPAQRDTFELTYLGFSAEEVSAILGVSPATVRSNLRHARQALKKVAVPESL